MNRPAALLALLAGVPGLVAQAPAWPTVQHRFTLANGLQVVHLEDHERPLVRAWLNLELAPGEGLLGRPEVAALALRMQEHADAGPLKAITFHEVLEGSGTRLTRRLDPQGLTWQMVARSRYQDQALGLLADRVLRTVFDPAALEAQRLACWLDATRLDATPRATLRRALEPYPVLRTPTMAGLSAVTLADLLAFQTRTFHPTRAVLVLHGDLGLEQAKRLVLLTFGTWSAEAGGPPTAATAAPAPRPASSVDLPVSGAPLRLQVVAAAPEDLAPEAVALLSLLLAGDPALRPATLTVDGPRLVATLVEGDSATGARAALADRLEALRLRGFSAIDLAQAKSAWTAGRTLLTLHPEALMAEALVQARGRAARAERVTALSLEELNAALRRWLAPARLQVGAVGDPAILGSPARP